MPDFATLGDFREGWDAYVSDHFPPRLWLISGLNYLRYKLGYSGTSRVIVGREGWLFYDTGDHLGQLAAHTPLSKPEVDAWVSAFEARSAEAAAIGAKYFVFAPPVKERVYAELAPAWAGGYRRGEADADRIADAMDGRGIIGFSTPIADLRDARSDVIYTPYDIHWTGKGGYIGYRNLLNLLNRLGLADMPLPLSRFQQVSISPESQPRDVAGMLGISSFIRQNYPRYENSANSSGFRTEYLSENQDWTGPRVITTGYAGPVLQLVIDSFSNDLLPFLLPHFSKIILSHNQDGFYRPDLMRKYRPDFVGIEVIESGVRHAMSGGQFGNPAPAAPIPIALPVQTTPPVASLPIAEEMERNGAWVMGAVTVERQNHRCNLESIETGQRALHLVGWFGDVENGKALSEAFIVAKANGRQWRHPLIFNVARPDVAAHFSSGLTQSGFDVTISTQGLPPGHYEFTLLSEKDSLECLAQKSLDLQ